MENKNKTPKTHEQLLDWFVHDSNGSLCQISGLIENYLISGDEADKEILVQAKMICSEALHMNSLLRKGVGGTTSVKDNLEIWARYKEYPKVRIFTNGEDHNLWRFTQVRYLIAIVAELSKNAHKAGAKFIDITLVGKYPAHLIISNDGKPMENPDKIFEKGFSTFGTTGEGLGIISRLCGYGDFKFELIDPIKVTFKLTLDTTPTLKVYHAIKPNFGIGDHPEFNEDNYELVAEIENGIVSKEDAFLRTQNLDGEWCKADKIIAHKERCRSTSVGDVIVRLGVAYRCENVGFTEIKKK